MTEQEQQELEMLRKEKRQRTQQARAQAALETAGVPASFAALLAGEDDGDTARRAADFCAPYQAALADAIPGPPPPQGHPAQPLKTERRQALIDSLHRKKGL